MINKAVDSQSSSEPHFIRWERPPSVSTSAGAVVSPRPKSSEITKAEATQEVMESGTVTSKSS